MSEIIDDEFDKIVELDIKKQATEEQIDELMEDLDLWRDCLVQKMREIDRQLTERKAISIAAHNFNARREYEAWKRGAVTYKLSILERLSEVKARLKDQNRASNDWGMILQEITAIRKLLEAKL